MKDFFEKLFASLPLTVLILGAIFIALGALGGIPLNTPVQTVDNPGRYAFFIAGGTLLIIAAVLIFRQSKAVKFPKSNVYGITLDTPSSPNNIVAAPVEGERPQVSGAYKQKPPDGMFRLFIYDHNENRYWPQSKKYIRWEPGKSGGRWFGSVRMGGEPGYEMTVIAALVPPSGQVLSEYYYKVGDLANWMHFDGSVPDDFVIIGKIKVIKVK
jgi:hypothetical protein